MPDPEATSTVANGLMKAIEWSALGIEVLAVAIIVYGSLHGSIRFLFHVRSRMVSDSASWRPLIGSSMIIPWARCPVMPDSTPQAVYSLPFVSAHSSAAAVSDESRVPQIA